MGTDSQSQRFTPPQDPLWRRILGWPSTRLGWWSVGLLIGFFVFFSLFTLLVEFGQRGGETFFSNPWLASTMLVAASSAIAAGVTAVVAIFGRHERSLLSILALLIGMFVLAFVLGEIIYPH
jgi:hypothetical protein